MVEKYTIPQGWVEDCEIKKKKYCKNLIDKMVYSGYAQVK